MVQERVCQHRRVELTPKEFQGSVEMPQPVPAGVSRRLRLALWGCWAPNTAVLGSTCSSGACSAQARGAGGTAVPGQQIPYHNTQGDVGFFWCIVIEPPQGES